MNGMIKLNKAEMKKIAGGDPVMPAMCPCCVNEPYIDTKWWCQTNGPCVEWLCPVEEPGPE